MSDYLQGSTNQFLSPNFRLGEFRDASGPAYVHRDLVEALQMLRGAHGASILVRSMKAPAAAQNPAPRGEGVLIEAVYTGKPANQANALICKSWLARVTPVGARLRDHIPEPLLRHPTAISAGCFLSAYVTMNPIPSNTSLRR